MEAQVARILEERDREREKERLASEVDRSESLREESSAMGGSTPSKRRSTRSKSRSPRKEDSQSHVVAQPTNPLPPGILTPLLKRHKDMDNELQNRLLELERK